VTAECRRVLKPSGSIFVNLGDKYSGNQPHNGWPKDCRNPDSEQQSPAKDEQSKAARVTDFGGIPAKSLMMLPQRYAIGCIDQLGLILRAEMIWSKPNGLPESVTDRVRRSHEQWFHFTKEPRYFSAVDEIREPHQTNDGERGNGGARNGMAVNGHRVDHCNHSPLGKLPGSVWTVPTEPLRVPDHLGVDHFAAFPSEFPRRLILGWSPSGVCVACGEGRRPVVAKAQVGGSDFAGGKWHDGGKSGDGGVTRGTLASRTTAEATITGYACACPDTTAPTRPAVVLDPFSGTGTTAAVAHILGRHGVGIDLSADYLRLAEWRCNDPALRAKVLRVDKPKAVPDGQLDIFGGAA